jgi:trk system potassium uptake protein TrkA
VLEVEIVPGARVTQHVLAKLELPQGCLIAAVMRDEFAYVPGADDRLKEGDTAVVLVDETAIDAVTAHFKAAANSQAD